MTVVLFAGVVFFASAVFALATGSATCFAIDTKISMTRTKLPLFVTDYHVIPADNKTTTYQPGVAIPVRVYHTPRANGDLVPLAGILLYAEDMSGNRVGSWTGFDGTLVSGSRACFATRSVSHHNRHQQQHRFCRNIVMHRTARGLQRRRRLRIRQTL